MRKIKRYRKKIIVMLDLIIIIFSCYIYHFLVPFAKATKDYDVFNFLLHIITLIISIALCQYFLKTYDIIWRYAEGKEYVRLMIGVVEGFIIYMVINHLIFMDKTSTVFSAATCSISVFFMLLMRFIYRIYRAKIKKKIKNEIPIVIIGAGSVGVRLMEEIQGNPDSNYKIYYFLDDNLEKIGKKIRGIKVFGPINKFEYLIKNTPISEVIIAIPTLTQIRKREILNIVSKSNLRVKLLPDFLSILQNSESDLLDTVSDFNADDLLGRDCVSFDKEEIYKFFNNKIIMVTGGGGSIGSELCRQIAQSQPAQLIIIDYYENNAYDIQQELIYDYKNKLNLAVEIASVQDRDKIEQLFERYNPQIVFHAAAHKHVPFMESCADEAIKNNVLGTYNMVKASNKWNVQKFVLISTDKAVNPTSIMGASKRMCEMIIQSMKNISKTEFVAVRFGNVLGSNGSVIPLFKRQIEHGGPITITDKRVYRYFMTIAEAAQLVLRAGSMESDSEIYVLDMGKPVNILKLAEKLTRLLGHIPYKEIAIKEIGMRPGEKLNEELFMHEELVKTENQKIYIEKQKSITLEEIEIKIDILNTALETKDICIIREALISIVPSFQVRRNGENYE